MLLPVCQEGFGEISYRNEKIKTRTYLDADYKIGETKAVQLRWPQLAECILTVDPSI